MSPGFWNLQINYLDLSTIMNTDAQTQLISSTLICKPWDHILLQNRWVHVEQTFTNKDCLHVTPVVAIKASTVRIYWYLHNICIMPMWIFLRLRRQNSTSCKSSNQKFYRCPSHWTLHKKVTQHVDMHSKTGPADLPLFVWGHPDELISRGIFWYLESQVSLL